MQKRSMSFIDSRRYVSFSSKRGAFISYWQPRQTPFPLLRVEERLETFELIHEQESKTKRGLHERAILSTKCH